MTGRLRYFAYGSNMSSARLFARIRSPVKLGVARLDGHCLRFHKVSHDGSAKCDVEPSDIPGQYVLGVLFDIAEHDRPLLDRHEGLGKGYRIEQVRVDLGDQTILDAFTYCATRTDDRLLPYDWYKQHVLRGALEHGLPPEYVAAIGAVPTMADPDGAREQRELAIYR